MVGEGVEVAQRPFLYKTVQIHFYKQQHKQIQDCLLRLTSLAMLVAWQTQAHFILLAPLNWQVLLIMFNVSTISYHINCEDWINYTNCLSKVCLLNLFFTFRTMLCYQISPNQLTAKLLLNPWQIFINVFLMLVLLRRTSFWPPSMVYISINRVHITDYKWELSTRTLWINVMKWTQHV